MTACDPRIPHEHDVSDPAEHLDDSYGGCVICRYYIPHTDDEYVSVPYPCPTVRLSGLQQEAYVAGVAAAHAEHEIVSDVLERLGQEVDAARAETKRLRVVLQEIDALPTARRGEPPLLIVGGMRRIARAALAIPEPVSAEE